MLEDTRHLYAHPFDSSLAHQNMTTVNQGSVVYNAASADGGHAVAIVGYTPTTFIIRNSWGTTEWGDKGYAYASNAYAKAAFTESYGITL